MALDPTLDTIISIASTVTWLGVNNVQPLTVVFVAAPVPPMHLQQVNSHTLLPLSSPSVLRILMAK
jgi:hypothetical protein